MIMIIPNPGSRDAIAQGCTCPVIDNHYGRGFPYPRKDGLDPELHPSFWCNEECPLHIRSVCEGEGVGVEC